MNEKLTKLIIFIVAVVIHLVLIFYLVFNTETSIHEPPEVARVMNLIDIAELPPPPVLPPLPPPPPPPPSDNQITNQVEAIAEHMIETDTPPDYEIAAAGTIHDHYQSDIYGFGNSQGIQQVSSPIFDETAIRGSLIYPRIAQERGIEGKVFLELFVDRTGLVQGIKILSEEPEGRGFGEAAVRVFTGRKGDPAYANGEPVSSRYTYTLTFRLR